MKTEKRACISCRDATIAIGYISNNLAQLSQMTTAEAMEQVRQATGVNVERKWLYRRLEHFGVKPLTRVQAAENRRREAVLRDIGQLPDILQRIFDRISTIEQSPAASKFTQIQLSQLSDVLAPLVEDAVQKQVEQVIVEMTCVDKTSPLVRSGFVAMLTQQTRATKVIAELIADWCKQTGDENAAGRVQAAKQVLDTLAAELREASRNPKEFQVIYGDDMPKLRQQLLDFVDVD